MTQTAKDFPERMQEGGWQVQEKGMKAVKNRGRQRREAVQMMKGLKSVKRLVQNKLQKERPYKMKYQAYDHSKMKLTPDDYDRIEQAKRDLREFEGRDAMEEEYTPSLKDPGEDDEDANEEQFWQEVRKQEEHAKEDERRLKGSLDDVPASLKRQFKKDEGGEAKVRKQFFQQLEVMVADQQMKGSLRKKPKKKCSVAWRGLTCPKDRRRKLNPRTKPTSMCKLEVERVKSHLHKDQLDEKLKRSGKNF